MILNVKQISSLEKVGFSDIDMVEPIRKKTIMKGESFSYQIVVKTKAHTEVTVKVDSPLEKYVKLYAVKNAVLDRVMFDGIDDDYIVDRPCLMPDILVPFELENNHVLFNNEEGAIWVTVDIPENIDAGEYENTLHLFLKSEDLKMNSDSGKTDSKTDTTEVSQTMVFDVVDSSVPEQEIFYTQWFHTDCIADVHNVHVYSEKHWSIIGKYMDLAVELGVNMILTPIITPPLDTALGLKRTNVQLVKIEKVGKTYDFDFSLLKRWIELADSKGISYFEMSHLFSQGGLEYTPNIVARENGEEKYIFGWDVKATSAEYKNFLEQLVPSLTAFLKTEGVAERCWFHISDEPREEHVEKYEYAYNTLKPMLEGLPTFDAISDYDFYGKGLIPNPVAATNFIEPFIKHGVENLWAYYCCGQGVNVGNRFMAMPSYRNRILGLQLYKFNIKGFLHWGFNFYYSKLSRKVINPYVTTSADKGFPSGDSFSVYPVEGGAVPSIRAVIFREALNDIAVCRKLESYIGRDKVVSMIDEAAEMELTFSQYPRSAAFVPSLIEKMEQVIKSFAK